MRYALIYTITGKTYVKDYDDRDAAMKEFDGTRPTLRVTRIELWDRKEFESLGVKGSVPAAGTDIVKFGE